LFEKMGMRKDILTDQQWAKIEPLLPKLKSKGRPWADNRKVLEGILWVLRSAARDQKLAQARRQRKIKRQNQPAHSLVTQPDFSN
jgi:transposase